MLLSVVADEQQTGADFSVKSVYPENQMKPESGYFHLKVTPGESQTIEVEVTNYSDKENTILVDRYRATTSDNGQISYREYDQEKVQGIPIDFENIVTILEKSIKIEPNSAKKVPVMIKMPEKSFPGMVLGGLRFYQDAPDLKDKSGIVNTFSYSSPVLLTENSEDKPKNELSLISVWPSQRNSHPFIEATLENKAATVIENLVVDGKVYIKGENEPIYVKKEANLEMAPYSYFNLGFDLHDSMLEAGKYHLVLNIKADEEDYVFEDDFEVTAKEARDFNENSVYAPEKNTSYLLYIIIGLIFIILLIFVIFIVKNNISK